MCSQTLKKVLHGISGNLGVECSVSVSVSRAYPLRAVTPPAPSAFTAGPFCCGKMDENRPLPQPALRFAPGPLLPAPCVGPRPTTCFASLHLALRLRRRVLRTCPRKTPPLGRPRSQFAASEPSRTKSKSKSAASCRVGLPMPMLFSKMGRRVATRNSRRQEAGRRRREGTRSAAQGRMQEQAVFVYFAKTKWTRRRGGRGRWRHRPPWISSRYRYRH